MESTVATLRATLVSEDESLAARIRALFSLKHLATTSTPFSSEPIPSTVPAIKAIADAFPTPSVLLKHELAYCLGQTHNPAAVPHLRGVLKDKSEDAMFRHEAAEALGALGDIDSLPLLREREKDADEAVVVRETCEIAAARIEWQEKEKAGETLQKSDFASVDPAPPLPQGAEKPSIDALENALMDPKLPLFQRYRAMFALRDLASPSSPESVSVPAVHALAKGFADKSALFRHEIAFVFGQLQHKASIPSLVATLSNMSEEGMVRHEAAEALGSLGEEEGVEDTLRRYLNDPEKVVRDSVIVALDMAEFEKSGQMEYATIPDSAKPVAV